MRFCTIGDQGETLQTPDKYKKKRDFTNFNKPLVVREKGVEPPHLAALEPKSSASTNSATLAVN